jgi:hypothetical protein
MTNLLVVPIYLDALVLEQPTLAVEAFADFSRQPYFNGERDVNPDVPYISEEILSQPFQNQNLLLQPGVHLHWALPDALAHGTHSNKGAEFPAVPNRWLITRSRQGEANRQWVIESDYLWDPRIIASDSHDPMRSVPYPYVKDPRFPFRYLGRCMDLDSWDSHTEPSGNYLEKLTAIGYGEPAFAALYPNCYSVFGFWDKDQTNINNIGDAAYEVLGWYSNGGQDYLSQWIEQFKKANTLRPPSLDEQLKSLRESAKWVNRSVMVTGKPEIIAKIVCYARTEFRSSKSKEYQGVSIVIGPPDVPRTTSGSVNFPVTISGADTINLEPAHVTLHKTGTVNANEPVTVTNGTTAAPTITLSSITGEGTIGISISSRAATAKAEIASGAPNTSAIASLAIGSTSTEALSACLADRLSSDDKTKQIIEEQLEALHLAPGLEKRRLDVGPKFQEARHTKGFRPVPAGNIWTLRPESSPQPGQRVNRSEQVTIPIDLADMLNMLNDAQQAHDQAGFELEALRNQLFSDWCKYMVCAYPPVDTLDDYPNIDEVKHFIEERDIPPLTLKASLVGKLKISVDKAVESLLNSDAMRDLQKVVESDIQDWNGFLDKLKTSPYQLIDHNLLELDQDPGKQKDQRFQVLNEINKSVMNPDFHRGLALPATLIDKLDYFSTSSKEAKRSGSRLNRLLLEAIFPEHIAHRPDYLLKKVPAPRFWEPNDPVVLLTGDIVAPTNRHGSEGYLHVDGMLQCGILSMHQVDFGSGEALNKIRAAITSQLGTLGCQYWAQPWNPILLEWEVEFFPTAQGNNTQSDALTYDTNFIEQNYQLRDKASGFHIIDGRGMARAANVYTGRSILTPHAKNQLKLKLEEYLQEELLDSYYKARMINSDDRKLSMLDKQISDIRSWYEGPANVPNFSKPVYTAIRAYEELQNINVLAQSLGGFDQALLMHKLTLQLPIEDPIGFDEYQKFATTVNNLIKKNGRSAPQPLNDFNPIRAGELKILRLRLIDTFGKVRDIPCEKLINSETMPAGAQGVSLLPRLTQAARLNFRWLSAQVSESTPEKDETEMNDHPATSPICGWILPNNLDDSLMIYEASGQSLGSFDREGTWHSAPGHRPRSITDIPNSHLRKLVNYLYKQFIDKVFFEDFMSAIENALENIDPENFAHHEALALLMGRPIAVVRASLNLELQGRPAINHDWNVFRQDMQGTVTQKDVQGVEHLVRTTDGFTQVKFPIRIGEYQQLNDGLIGYWVEKEAGYEDDNFYAPQTSSEINHPNIVIHRSDDPAMIQQSVDDPPHKLTMLLDPRGVVHATCGLLPAKSIQMPSDQFADAMRNIEVTFLSAPVLTDVGKINLPLPQVPGYQWSWLEKENGVWADEYNIGNINPQATFAAKQVIREGWLKLRHRPDEKTS